MAKMTAVMEAMSYRRTVPSAMKLEISAVQTTDAFPSKYFIFSFSGMYAHVKCITASVAVHFGRSVE
jgi:hypothetical protein